MGLALEAWRRPKPGSRLWVTFERGGKPLARVSSGSGRVRWGPRPGLELAFPVHGLEGPEELFRPAFGGARLMLHEGMTGELWAGGTRLALEELDAWGLVRGRGKRHSVRLTREMCGRIEYRGLAFVFEFADAPALEAKLQPAAVPRRFRRPLLAREDRPFGLLIWGTYVALFALVLLLATRELPKEVPPEAVARRFAKLVYTAPQAQTRARKEILKRLEAEGKKKEAEEPKVEEQPEPKPEPQPKREEKAAAEAKAPEPGPAAEGPAGPSGGGARVEEIRRAVAGKGLLGLLGGRGGAAVGQARGSILQGGGSGGDLDRLLDQVEGLRSGPEPGGGGAAAAGARAVPRGIDDAARQVAAATGRPPQLQERKDLAIASREADLAPDPLSLKEATAAINRVVATYLGGIRYLYNKELRKNPDLEGKLTVSMTIAPNGTVSDCRVVDSTLGAPELERAVLDRIRKWTFPSVSDRPITVTYPFVFFPSM